MEYYAGLDLGKRKSHVKVITAERAVVEDLAVANEGRTLKRVFAKYKGRIQVACEACSNAFWIADTLEPLVRRVRVGDTKKIRWIAEARIKTDRIDAGILAELLRADLFPEISIPPRRIRELRELARGMVRMKRQAVRARNQVHGLLTRFGICYKKSESRGEKLLEVVKEAGLARPALRSAEGLLKMEKVALDEGRGLKRAMTKELREESEVKEKVKRLETIPGVGFVSALLLVMELWEIERFRGSSKLPSYIGLVPSTHQSGDVHWQGRMTKQGNVFLRWILIQDAWAAARSNIYFGRLYEQKKNRPGKSRAIVPVARKLLDTIWRVWTEQKTYQELCTLNSWVG